MGVFLHLFLLVVLLCLLMFQADVFSLALNEPGSHLFVSNCVKALLAALLCLLLFNFCCEVTEIERESPKTLNPKNVKSETLKPEGLEMPFRVGLRERSWSTST
jgi:hypothetical protein